MEVNFPFASGMSWHTALPVAGDEGIMFSEAHGHNTTTSHKGHPSLLHGGGGTDCGHESLHDAKVVMDDLGQGGSAGGGTEALLMITRELYFSGSHSAQTWGHQQKGQR
jgi:hypothetical protein